MTEVTSRRIALNSFGIFADVFSVRIFILASLVMFSLVSAQAQRSFSLEPANEVVQHHCGAPLLTVARNTRP